MLDAVISLPLLATSFTTILVIQDPLGAVPIFLSLTSRQTPPERAASARQATVVSFAVIVLFAVFGRYILKFLGISVPALQISGGLLLLLVALELLTDKADEGPDPNATANVALVPLGTPLLAGPGAIVASMAAVESASTATVGWVSVTVAIVLTHVAGLPDPAPGAGGVPHPGAHPHLRPPAGRHCRADDRRRHDRLHPGDLLSRAWRPASCSSARRCF